MWRTHTHTFPCPLRYVPSFLSREWFSSFFPRRLASNCTYAHVAWRSQQLVDPFFFACRKRSKNLPTGWESNARTNASSIRGQPLDHRGDRYIISRSKGYIFPSIFLLRVLLIILVLLSRSHAVVTQILGHIAGSPSPCPLRYVPSCLSREEFWQFLPSSTRVDLYLPTLLGALSC